jgi:hypothetical protein
MGRRGNPKSVGEVAKIMSETPFPWWNLGAYIVEATTEKSCATWGQTITKLAIKAPMSLSLRIREYCVME